MSRDHEEGLGANFHAFPVDPVCIRTPEILCDLHLPSSSDFHGFPVELKCPSLLSTRINVCYRLHVRTMYVPYVIAVVHTRESLFSDIAYALQVTSYEWREKIVGASSTLVEL